MLIELLGMLVIIAIAFVVFGYYSQTPAYSLVGFFIFFMIAIVLINNSVQYKIGLNIVEANATDTVITYNYGSYPDTRIIGIFMGIISFIGAILSIIHGTNRRDK